MNDERHDMIRKLVSEWVAPAAAGMVLLGAILAIVYAARFLAVAW